MAEDPYKFATDNGRFVSVQNMDVEIQAGHFYKLNNKVTDLGAGSTHSIQLKTADKFSFLQNIKINISDGPIDIVIREEPTITDGTTEVDIINLNRENPLVSQAVAYNNPSGISGGTFIQRHFIPAGKDTAFVLEDNTHWILKRNTDYTVQIVNNSGQLLTFSYTIVYHEHE